MIFLFLEARIISPLFLFFLSFFSPLFTFPTRFNPTLVTPTARLYLLASMENQGVDDDEDGRTERGLGFTGSKTPSVGMW